MNSGVSRADLHLHTDASDGAYSPTEMVRRAAQAGMEWIAITDHDVTDGIAEALRAGQAEGVAVLPGIELSTGDGEEIHLLGYGISPENTALQGFLAKQMRGRHARMLQMLERLDAMGLPVSSEETRGSSQFMGRMRLAYAMVERGYARTAQEAFDRYLNPGKPAFVPRKRVSATEGIQALHSFGAVVALAHPGRLHMPRASLLALLPQWREAGLSGLEAYHSSHDAATAAELDRLARRHDLLVTGGSDSHGRKDGAQIGCHLRGWHSVREDTARLLDKLAELE